MTERQAAWAAIAGSAAACLLGFFWPLTLRLQILHLAILFVFFLTFVQVRRAGRPFGMGVRAACAGLALLPAFRGGEFLHQIWLAAVWFGLLEYTSAAVRRGWMQSVRHRLAVRRLKGARSAAAARLSEMKTVFDRVQEEITLYQTVYDLATGQTAGMARADILNAAGQSLKELARRRALHIQSMSLFLASGENIDLQHPQTSIVLNKKLAAVKERAVQTKEGVLREGSWVGLPIRYQDRLLGSLVLEIGESSGNSSLSQTDIKLLSVTSDLLGLAIQNSLLYDQVNQMAITDRLTGLHVLWYFKERLTEEVHRAMRNRRPLSVLMMDLDHFKRVNDTHGHLSGDAVLREASSRIKLTLREGDFLARYGGEEIIAMLPETSLESAAAVAERIRIVLSKTPIPIQSGSLTVSISVGVNELSQSPLHEDPGLTATRLLKGADEALYRAKHDGRNCVRLYGSAGAVEAVKA